MQDTIDNPMPDGRGGDPVGALLARVPRPSAPADLTRRVMDRLPARPPWRRRRLRRALTWVLPPLAAAAAAALVLLRTPAFRSGDLEEAVFVFHAPEATRVELVGDFTAWRRERIPMRGPDADGYWSARVRLPAGRYEYQFLVEGERWVTDPLAVSRRPDGFGLQNAVVNL